MTELIKQILSLPKSTKWKIFALLAEELRSEEVENSTKIPQWQIDLATKACLDIESGELKPMNHEQFWAKLDAHLENRPQKIEGF